MSVDNLYNEIFTTDDKAKAFDEIAKCYYDRNFGTMSKSDLEVLLFSIYIDRILDKIIKMMQLVIKILENTAIMSFLNNWEFPKVKCVI